MTFEGVINAGELDTGAIACTSLTSAGAVEGATVAAVGALTAATLATTGSVTAGTQIICANFNSLASRTTLTSGLAIYAAGALTGQDGANADAPAALVLADIPFCASYLISAPRAFVLPEIVGGGMPQGVRMTFFVTGNNAVTFQSAARIIENIRNTDAGLA